ncbi:MAG: hypothetical protein QNJ15_04380 [Erythrobacter sp.]|nr:hypothetical protein [Erythrobacter sp.]
MSAPTTFTEETIQAYVLGTLDPETAASVARASQDDPALRAEIALWRASRDIHTEDAAASAQGEFGWARIERAIAQSDPPALPVAANDDAPFWRRPRFAAWQVAASVAIAVLGWQGLVVPAITSSDEPAAYNLAGDADSSAFTLRVSFQADVSEAELRALLGEADARIVDGPSAIGLYTLGFADADAKAAAAELLGERREIVAEIAE